MRQVVTQLSNQDFGRLEQEAERVRTRPALLAKKIVLTSLAETWARQRVERIEKKTRCEM